MIRELKTEKGQLFNQLQDVYKVAENEKRSLASDEVAKADKLMLAMNEKDAQIRNFQDFAKRKAEFETVPAQGGHSTRTKKEKSVSSFNKFLRSGIGSLSQEERSYLSRGTGPQTTVNAAGGYNIPEGWTGELDFATQFVGEVEGISRIFATKTGNILPIPKVDDTAQDAVQQTEGAATAVADMTFGNTDLSAYTYSTLVKVSEQLLQDEDVNLTSYLAELLGQRIARKTNADLTTGDGSGKANGIITAATVGVTAAAVAAITHEELIDLFYSVDPSYRMGSKVNWMCNDTVHSAIRKLGLTASENYNPISFTGDGTMFILGKEVKINQDMTATINAGAKTLLFGDFNGYAVRTAGGISIKRLSERYGDELNVGFLAYRRIDGNLISAGAPLKVLQQAAS
jgi:HK97 family phage major capsid protein